MHARLALSAVPPALVLVAFLALLPAPKASAGTYLVRQCHHAAPQNDAHEATLDAAPNPGPYAVAAGPGVCSGAGNDFAIQTSPSGPALHGQYGRVRFTAPEGTKLVGVELDARLRSEAGHRARLSMTTAAGVEQVRFGAGASGATSFSHYAWPGAGPPGEFQQFTAGLVCDNPGFDCPLTGDGDRSKADIRNVQLTVEDQVAPTISSSGDATNGTWQRGVANLKLAATDTESGVYLLSTIVNGQFVAGAAPLPCSTISGSSAATRFQPCQENVDAALTLDTTSAPFRDGANTLASCAVDYGYDPNGNCTEHAVLVDNTNPSLVFRAAQEPGDPELVRAAVADETSGVDAETGQIEFRPAGTGRWEPLATSLSGGELQARVDSESAPPGLYEFQASVADNAGNENSSSTREDGEPMVLEFPLKDGVSLDANLGNGKDDQVIGFRKAGTVGGRLVDERGNPIAGASIEVVETFEEGALLDRRVRTVTTGKKGRYESKLPGGPSRDVEVLYEGSPRYIGATEHGLDFDVRGKATLRTSQRKVRAGKAVVFKGRVKRYFAQIPAGGKLVEVQVKSGRSWTTLREATGTNRKGRVRLRHRFRGFYTQPVTFTFRLKATRESGWPYKGATKSQRQRVTVLPKR